MDLCRAVNKAIDRVVDSKWFTWLLNRWVIRGYSVFGVLVTLVGIVVSVSVFIGLPIAGLIWWQTGTFITLGSIAALVFTLLVLRAAR